MELKNYNPSHYQWCFAKDREPPTPQRGTALLSCMSTTVKHEEEVPQKPGVRRFWSSLYHCQSVGGRAAEDAGGVTALSVEDGDCMKAAEDPPELIPGDRTGYIHTQSPRKNASKPTVWIILRHLIN